MTTKVSKPTDHDASQNLQALIDRSPELAAVRGRPIDPVLARRDALKVIGATSAFVMTGCDGETPPDEELAADGSFARPWTASEPGENPDVHFPVLYGAEVSDSEKRLWVEVLDPGNGEEHEMTEEHYVKQIVIFDEHGNEITGAGFAYWMQARLIYHVAIPDEVTQLYVYSECNLHGWWLSVYDVADIKGDPVGDYRRPFTLDRPGEWGDVAAKHKPIFGRRPDGSYSIEIGDRDSEELHVMTEQHYMSWVFLFDEYAQLRRYVELSPDYNAEPVYDFEPFGSPYIRIVTYCNLHGWWEGVYSLSETSE